MPLLDVVEVAEVVLGQVDRVMREVVESPLDAQVEHERRAGELLPGDLAVGPAAAERVGHEPGHGAGEVGVDHQGVALVDARTRPDADGPSAPEQDLLGPRRRARSSRPASGRSRAIDSVTAEQPPIGWKTPYSYSMNERIEKRLGHWNGDIPRYLDWNVMASRTRGSSEVSAQLAVERVQAAGACGRTRARWGVDQVVPLRNGDSRIGRNRSIFDPVLGQEPGELGGVVRREPRRSPAASARRRRWPSARRRRRRPGDTAGRAGPARPRRLSSRPAAR